jgi:hypothetical protein
VLVSICRILRPPQQWQKGGAVASLFQGEEALAEIQPGGWRMMKASVVMSFGKILY